MRHVRGIYKNVQKIVTKHTQTPTDQTQRQDTIRKKELSAILAIRNAFFADTRHKDALQEICNKRTAVLVRYILAYAPPAAIEELEIDEALWADSTKNMNPKSLLIQPFVGRALPASIQPALEADETTLTLRNTLEESTTVHRIEAVDENSEITEVSNAKTTLPPHSTTGYSLIATNPVCLLVYFDDERYFTCSLTDDVSPTQNSSVDFAVSTRKPEFFKDEILFQDCFIQNKTPNTIRELSIDFCVGGVKGNHVELRECPASIEPNTSVLVTLCTTVEDLSGEAYLETALCFTSQKKRTQEKRVCKIKIKEHACVLVQRGGLLTLENKHGENVFLDSLLTDEAVFQIEKYIQPENSFSFMPQHCGVSKKKLSAAIEKLAKRNSRHTLTVFYTAQKGLFISAKKQDSRKMFVAQMKELFLDGRCSFREEATRRHYLELSCEIETEELLMAQISFLVENISPYQILYTVSFPDGLLKGNLFSGCVGLFGSCSHTAGISLLQPGVYETGEPSVSYTIQSEAPPELFVFSEESNFFFF
ncbi:MAG: uncharacterized protein A8A55_1038 [Amphiamblys sp. WSBS2006]|nr:MAG: uncharacterized protein A8A55_1038 [Amphiamblys sp. WSBS2006]